MNQEGVISQQSGHKHRQSVSRFTVCVSLWLAPEPATEECSSFRMKLVLNKFTGMQRGRREKNRVMKIKFLECNQGEECALSYWNVMAY
jgi:hypothetical protein